MGHDARPVVGRVLGLLHLVRAILRGGIFALAEEQHGARGSAEPDRATDAGQYVGGLPLVEMERADNRDAVLLPEPPEWPEHRPHMLIAMGVEPQ